MHNNHSIYESILPNDFKGSSVLIINNKDKNFLVDITSRNAGNLLEIDYADNLDSSCRFDYIYMNTGHATLKQQLALIKNILKICNFRFYIVISGTINDKPAYPVEKLYYYINQLNPCRSLNHSIPSYYKHLKNQFKHMFSVIKSINYIPSLNSGYSCLIFEMRMASDLLIISGPSGVGKSHFLDKISNDEKYFEDFGSRNLSDYHLLTGVELKESEGLHLDKILLHYNITRDPNLDYSSHENEPAHIIERSGNKTVYILMCSSNILIERVKKRVRGKRFWSRKLRIANSIIGQYSRPGLIKQLYLNWIDYCKSHGCKLFYIDVSSDDSIRFLTEKKALDLIN